MFLERIEIYKDILSKKIRDKIALTTITFKAYYTLTKFLHTGVKKNKNKVLKSKTKINHPKILNKNRKSRKYRSKPNPKHKVTAANLIKISKLLKIIKKDFKQINNFKIKKIEYTFTSKGNIIRAEKRTEKILFRKKVKLFYPTLIEIEINQNLITAKEMSANSIDILIQEQQESIKMQIQYISGLSKQVNQESDQQKTEINSEWEKQKNKQKTGLNNSTIPLKRTDIKLQLKKAYEKALLTDRDNLKRLKIINEQMATMLSVYKAETIAIINELKSILEEKTKDNNHARAQTLILLQSLKEKSDSQLSSILTDLKKIKAEVSGIKLSSSEMIDILEGNEQIEEEIMKLITDC